MKNKWKKGSFTLEAALLMTIILPVLTAIIYMGFYVSDSGTAQGIVCELAAAGGDLSEEQDVQSNLENRKKMLITSRFLGMECGKASVNRETNRVSAEIAGDFYIPGLAARFFCGNHLKIQKKWSRELYRPAEMIRRIRGIQELKDTVVREDAE